MTEKTALHLSEVWPRFTEKIKGNLSEQIYDSWFAPIRPMNLDDGTLEIEVPNAFFKDWLVRHYKKLMDETLEQIGGRPLKLEIKVNLSKPQNSSPERHSGVHLKRTMPLQKEKNLNPNYSFDLFVVGPSNRFAHAAAIAVSQSPAKAYNPLFIYGGVGLGKTHLMHAIGQFVLENHPKMRVLYIS